MGAQGGRAWADEIAKQIAAEASPERNALLMTTPRSQKSYEKLWVRSRDRIAKEAGEDIWPIR